MQRCLVALACILALEFGGAGVMAPLQIAVSADASTVHIGELLHVTAVATVPKKATVQISLDAPGFDIVDTESLPPIPPGTVQIRYTLQVRADAPIGPAIIVATVEDGQGGTASASTVVEIAPLWAPIHAFYLPLVAR